MCAREARDQSDVFAVRTSFGRVSEVSQTSGEFWKLQVLKTSDEFRRLSDGFRAETIEDFES